MDDKEVTPFKPEDAMNSVKDRIKAEFVGLIPDDVWQGMIKKEVDDWMMERDVQYDYAKNNTYSHFGTFVRSLLEQKTKDLAQEIIDQELKEYALNDQNKLKVSAAVTKIIVEHSGEILVRLIGSQMQQAINNTHF